MEKGLNTPHILLASSNPSKMLTNLAHILNEAELKKLRAEVDNNVIALFRLGYEHFIFARALPDKNWRQKVSRCYYGAYNVRRAVALNHNGSFSTDSSDHKNVDQIPAEVSNSESHKIGLRDLREDRNLADYSHMATQSDLVKTVLQITEFTEQFVADCKTHLETKGITI